MNTSEVVRSHFFQRGVRGSAFAFALAMGVALFLPWAAVAQDTPPSGDVQFNQSTIEPAYNDLTGKITYFMTPGKVPEHANSHAQAPIYLILYPLSAASSVGTLNCQLQPFDNCPPHGANLAGLAEVMENSVYGSGVLGHDHLLAAPPSRPAAGGDFNISWYPVIVLFTKSSAANTHITTLEQLNMELADENVEEIPVRKGAFECVIVPAETYEMGTPVTGP